MPAGFTANPKKSLFGDKKPKVTIQASEPRVGNDGVECVISLDIIDEDENGIPDIKIQFYHDTVREGDPVETGSDGRASKKFKQLGIGEHVFEARLVGDRKIVKTKKVKVEADTHVPQDFSVEVNGSDGEYALLIKVKDVSGRGVRGVKFSVRDSRTTALDVRQVDGIGFTTDGTGSLLVAVKFEDGERFVSVVPMHAALKQKQVRLFGPRRK